MTTCFLPEFTCEKRISLRLAETDRDRFKAEKE